MKKNDWKDRLNIVYSTNPDFGYEMDDDEEQSTLDKDKQNLRVSIDKKNRGGKVARSITSLMLGIPPPPLIESGNINYRIRGYGERLERIRQAA